jgi:hypothetical protein
VLSHAACTHRTIFDTLYTLLAFGHASPEQAAVLDPPSSYFRARLVAVLLEACGAYFSKGSAGRKLDRFLAFFQRYLLAKPPLPLDVEFDVQARLLCMTATLPLSCCGLARHGHMDLVVWPPVIRSMGCSQHCVDGWSYLRLMQR